MRRFTSMKVGLASVLSCLALLLGLFSTTGTASAHTAHRIEPTISVSDVSREGSDCISFNLEGEDFSPRHHARLFAETRSGLDVSIDPDRVRINRHGNFSTDVQVCGFGQGEFFCNSEFIENPFSFCGFNFNEEDFCGFSGFHIGGGCFPGEESRFCFRLREHGIPCVFPLRRHRFCEFFDEPFCFFFRHRFLTVFITAEDEHTGIDSNTVAIRVPRSFCCF